MSLKNEKDVSGLNLTFIVLVANIGTLLFGYEVGATSWILYKIAISADLSASNAYYLFVEDNSFMTGLVASCASLGAAVLYPVLLYWANDVSKKDEVLLAALFFFIGALLQSVSGQVSWATPLGVILLLVGRFVYGCGIATTMNAIPQYISETLPPEVRGQYGSSIELTVMIGMSLGFGIGYMFEEQGNSGWVLIFRFAYIMALLMSVLSIFLPHNPTWLVYHGHPHEAILDSLQFIYPNATDTTVTVLVKKIEAEKIAMEEITRSMEARYALLESDNCHWMKTIGLYPLLTHQMRLIADDRLLSRCVTVKIVLNMLKILTGQTAILYFGSSIYTDLYPNRVQEIILGYILCRVAVAAVMIFIGDLLGRRVFLLLSAFIMCLSLVVAGLGFVLDMHLVAVGGLYGSGVGFEIGLGSIGYIVLNEVVPYYVRSSSNAISNFILFSCYFLMTFVFPYLSLVMGYAPIFFLFAAVNVYAMYFMFFYVPETRGHGMDVAYKLVDEMFNTAPQLTACWREKEVVSRAGQSEEDQETTSLLHKE